VVVVVVVVVVVGAGGGWGGGGGGWWGVVGGRGLQRVDLRVLFLSNSGSTDLPSICVGFDSPARARKVGARSTLPAMNVGVLPASTPGPRISIGTCAAGCISECE
jgi:hypothetical protein